MSTADKLDFLVAFARAYIKKNGCPCNHQEICTDYCLVCGKNIEDEDEPPTRRVVCAAVRCAGIIVCGPRHMDKTMRDTIAAIEGGRSSFGDWSKEQGFTDQFSSFGDWSKEQGFIDQFGVFMTREEALVIAKEAGQIFRRCGGDEIQLWSENLY